jgi:hypothetical protein
MAWWTKDKQQEELAMKTVAFDGMVQEFGNVSTRRGIFRLLGGAVAVGAGLAVAASDESLAKNRGKANRGRGRANDAVSAQGKGKKVTICFQNQTLMVKKSKLGNYPGFTKGACTGGGNNGGTQQQVACTSWILSGGPAVTAPIGVDDDLSITVNGNSILKDDNKMASNLPPVPFVAQPGDALAITAVDTNPACRGLSPLWLHCATTGQKKQLSAGNSDGCAPGRTAGQFFSQVFTVGV